MNLTCICCEDPQYHESFGARARLPERTGGTFPFHFLHAMRELEEIGNDTRFDKSINRDTFNS